MEKPDESEEEKGELAETLEKLAFAEAEKLAALTHSQVIEEENLRLIGENRLLADQLDDALRLASEAMGEVKALRVKLEATQADANGSLEREGGLSEDVRRLRETVAEQLRENVKLKIEIRRLGELVMERHDGRGE